jgi:NlpC/P60 family protein
MMVAGIDVVNRARQELGDPYVFGSHGPNTYDCSGLVEYVYRQLGIKVPGTTSSMMGPGSNLLPIQRGQLGPGDLVFSNWIGRRSSHVGIYAGNNQIIEAPEPGKTVTVTNMGPSYWGHADAFRRVPGVTGSPNPPNPLQAGVKAGLTEAGLGGLAGWIPNPGNVTDALSNVGNAMIGVAEGVGNIGALATTLTRAFLPSNLIRGVAFMFGVMFLLIGTWFLAREVRQ